MALYKPRWGAGGQRLPASSWQPGKLKKAAFVPLLSNVAWTEALPPSAAHKLMQCGKHCCRWLSDRLLLLFLGVDQTSHLSFSSSAIASVTCTVTVGVWCI